MKKDIDKINNFTDLFKKLSFGTEKYGASYTAVMFKIDIFDKLPDFEKFLLKYLRISDTIYYFSENTVLIILEDTTIKGAIHLCENLSEKIEEEGLTYKYFCSAIQGDYIETEKKLFKALKKRLKKAKEENNRYCVTEL